MILLTNSNLQYCGIRMVTTRGFFNVYFIADLERCTFLGSIVICWWMFPNICIYTINIFTLISTLHYASEWFQNDIRIFFNIFLKIIKTDNFFAYITNTFQLFTHLGLYILFKQVVIIWKMWIKITQQPDACTKHHSGDQYLLVGGRGRGHVLHNLKPALFKDYCIIISHIGFCSFWALNTGGGTG